MDPNDVVALVSQPPNVAAVSVIVVWGGVAAVMRLIDGYCARQIIRAMPPNTVFATHIGRRQVAVMLRGHKHADELNQSLPATCDEFVIANRDGLARLAEVICRSRGVPHHEVDDVLQEALIGLYKKWRKLVKRRWTHAKVWKYLRGILSHKAHDRAHRPTKNEMFNRKTATLECLRTSDPSDGRSAEDEMIRKLMADRLWAAIARLPSYERTVLVLKEFCGMSYADIANQRKGHSEHALREARRRATKMLREILHNDGWGRME